MTHSPSQSTDRYRIHLVAAARPNFMKVAPLYHALIHTAWCDPQIIHTGQHYDANMSDSFFQDLGLPRPHVSLGVGSGTHAEQTAGVMLAYERTCGESQPDWVVVVGDVNSTLACALVAVKLGVPVAHLEAGLRSGDRSMPEEINRLLTDAIADLLWTPSVDGDENLAREGIPAEKIERVGNIMIDSYELMRPAIAQSCLRQTLGLQVHGYGVVTLHRPSNVDDRATLARLCEGLRKTAQHIPLVFPVHPRTRARLIDFDLWRELAACGSIRLMEPQGYIDFMGLVSASRLVITDSGGIQEETSYLGIPCLTLRDTTERPITVTLGTNRLVDTPGLEIAASMVLNTQIKKTCAIPLWDGHTAERVANSLHRHLTGEPARGKGIAWTATTNCAKV